jgi:hypothetical protein
MHDFPDMFDDEKTSLCVTVVLVVVVILAGVIVADFYKTHNSQNPYANESR